MMPHLDLKYARGVSGHSAAGRREFTLIEIITTVHVGLFATFATWAFGGGAEWVRQLMCVWGSFGALITLTVVLESGTRGQFSLRTLRWLWPLGLFNALTLLACLVPNLREVRFGTEFAYARLTVTPWVPSNAAQENALRGLWLFDVIYLSCFNLALVVQQRRVLRALLLFLCGNALVLAVFGTLQKLSGAKGIYFGAVKSPQPYFFSTFVYHNHWGAFIVLMAAMSLALMWHYARRTQERGWLHTPAFGGGVVLFFMALTVPLSTSRSCTIQLLLLFAAALLHWIFRLIRKRREFNESAAIPVAGAILAVLLGAVGIWFMARDTIELRVAKTKQQITEMRARGDVGARGVLYRDTWRMAKDKLWFGWGMGSYPRVFMFYNTAHSDVDRLPVFYHDAHSDWIQSCAEHGLVGTLLLGLCALVPLRRLRLQHLTRPLPAYLMAGCTLLVLYAWLEFPFGNQAVVLTWWICFFSALHYTRLVERETERAPSSASAT